MARVGTLVAALSPKAWVRGLLHRLGWRLVREQDPFRLALYRQLNEPAVLQRKPFYNIGSGSFFHPCWTNIDYDSEWYRPVQRAVLHHDLLSPEPLPIADGSAKILYTSHTIEHVTDQAVQKLFVEAYRVLEPGGLFRITAPDAELDFRALQRHDVEWFRALVDDCNVGTADEGKYGLAEYWLHHLATPLSRASKDAGTEKLSEAEILAAIHEHGYPAVLDHFCSKVRFNPEIPGSHISWWTPDKVMQSLRKAGFTTVYRSGWNQSASPLLRDSVLFDSTMPGHSLFIEAVK